MTLTYNTEYWDGTGYDTEEYEIEVDDNIEDVEMFFKEYRLDPKEFIECALDDEDRYKKDGIEQMRESELYKYIYNFLYEELVSDEGFIDYMKDKYYDEMCFEKRDDEARRRNIYSYLGLNENDFH